MGTGRAGRLGTQSAEAAAARGVPSCVCGTMWSVTAGALDLSGTPVKAVAAVKSARLILVELGPEPPTIFFFRVTFLRFAKSFLEYRRIFRGGCGEIGVARGPFTAVPYLQ